MKKQINIVGTSHLALVVASGFLDRGFEVKLFSDEVEHVDKLNQLIFPIYEPNMKDIFQVGFNEKRLFIKELKENVFDHTDLIYLAEDVTKTKEGADLTNFFSLIKKITSIKKTSFHLIISTQLPVGTSQKLISLFETERNESNKIHLVHVPEFLRLGTAIDVYLSKDYLHIIGCENSESTRICENIFSYFPGKTYRLSLAEAEMAKHIANTYTATTVSFISEIIKVSELLSINLKPVTDVIRNDKRIGPKSYLSPGLGFSGGNLTRDLLVIKQTLEEGGEASPFFDMVLKVNDYHNDIVLRRLDSVFKIYNDLKIAFLGITYKSLTDTLKGSLTIRLGKKLIQKGALVYAYDPLVSKNEDFTFQSVNITSTIEKCIKDADCIVVMIHKSEFNSLNASLIAKSVKQKIILDAINYFNPEEFINEGFKYSGVGIGILF